MQAPARIRTVAVVGAGPLAVAFVQRCLRGGFDVVLEDVLPSALRSATATLLSSPQQTPATRLRTANTVEDAVREADLAVDFVPDELESKLEIVSMVDRMAPPRTMLCVPTEALSISDLASCTYRPERCFALHGLTHALAGGDGGAVRLTHPTPIDVPALAAVEHFLEQLGLRSTTMQDPAEPQLTRNRVPRPS